MKKSIQKGFTLIELMIVIAIIGILAAFALPAYQDYIGRTQVGEGVTLAGGQKGAVTEYYSDKGTFPANNADAGVAAADQITGKYVASVTITGDADKATITAKLKATPNAQKDVAEKEVVLETTAPAAQAGSFVWVCKAGTGLAAKFLPASCR